MVWLTVSIKLYTDLNFHKPTAKKWPQQSHFKVFRSSSSEPMRLCCRQKERFIAASTSCASPRDRLPLLDDGWDRLSRHTSTLEGLIGVEGLKVISCKSGEGADKAVMAGEFARAQAQSEITRQTSKKGAGEVQTGRRHPQGFWGFQMSKPRNSETVRTLVGASFEAFTKCGGCWSTPTKEPACSRRP